MTDFVLICTDGTVVHAHRYTVARAHRRQDRPGPQRWKDLVNAGGGVRDGKMAMHLTTIRLQEAARRGCTFAQVEVWHSSCVHIRSLDLRLECDREEARAAYLI
jgi:hypothetical protein